MLGFKRFDTAAVTISGIELAEKIKKVQFKVGKLPIDSVLAAEFWTLLAAWIQANNRPPSPANVRCLEFAPEPRTESNRDASRCALVRCGIVGAIHMPMPPAPGTPRIS